MSRVQFPVTPTEFLHFFAFCTAPTFTGKVFAPRNIIASLNFNTDYTTLTTLPTINTHYCTTSTTNEAVTLSILPPKCSAHFTGETIHIIWYTRSSLYYGNIQAKNRFSFQSVVEENSLERVPCFKASKGWLAKFKKRSNLKLQGELTSADQNIVLFFQEKFKKIVEEKDYSPKQIYNCEKTGLIWKRCQLAHT